MPPLKICDETSISIGQKIALSGFIDDKKPVSSEGKIVGLDLDRIKKPSILYDANSLPGMSGSPVFFKECVIGLHWGFRENFNQAIPMHLILKDIQND